MQPTSPSSCRIYYVFRESTSRNRQTAVDDSSQENNKKKRNEKERGWVVVNRSTILDIEFDDERSLNFLSSAFLPFRHSEFLDIDSYFDEIFRNITHITNSKRPSVSRCIQSVYQIIYKFSFSFFSTIATFEYIESVRRREEVLSFLRRSLLFAPRREIYI